MDARCDESLRMLRDARSHIEEFFPGDFRGYPDTVSRPFARGLSFLHDPEVARVYFDYAKTAALRHWQAGAWGRRGTARSLIERLTERGVSLRPVDGRVRCWPSSLLTDAEREEIWGVRDELYQLLCEEG